MVPEQAGLADDRQIALPGTHFVQLRRIEARQQVGPIVGQDGHTLQAGMAGHQQEIALLDPVRAQEPARRPQHRPHDDRPVVAVRQLRVPADDRDAQLGAGLVNLAHDPLDHGHPIVGRDDQGDDQPGGIRALAGDIVGVDVDQEPPRPGGRPHHGVGGRHEVRGVRPLNHRRILPESGPDRDVGPFRPGVAEHPLQEQVRRQFTQYFLLVFPLHEDLLLHSHAERIAERPVQNEKHEETAIESAFPQKRRLERPGPRSLAAVLGRRHAPAVGRGQDRSVSMTPAATAVPMTPATLGPMACIKR